MKTILKAAVLSASIAAAFGMTACQSTHTMPAATQAMEVSEFASIAKLQKGFGSSVAATEFAKIKSSVAGGDVAVAADFEKWIAGYTSAKAAAGSKGVAGVSAGKRGAILNGKGFEYNQLVKKGLIGAYQFSNAVAVVKSGASNQAKLEGVSKYLLGSYAELAKKGYKSKPAGNEFKKYLTKYEDLSKALYAALEKAEANVGNQAAFDAALMEALVVAQKASAKRTAYYLDYSAKFGDGSTPFDKVAHGVSEGLGFLYSLQFTHNPATGKPYYSREQVAAFLGKLDLYNQDEAKKLLKAESAKISAMFGL